MRAEPHIGLEEIDADEVVVRIAATPAAESDGPRLADEILAAIAPVTRDTDDDTRSNVPDARSAHAAGPRTPRHAGVRVLAERRGRRQTAPVRGCAQNSAPATSASAATNTSTS